jgi:hypothetical protein
VKTPPSLRGLGFGLLLCSPLLVGVDYETHYNDLSDPMLHGDPLGIDGKPAPMVPFAPGVDPGSDGRCGSDDDIVVSSYLGDVDIRVVTSSKRNGEVKPHGKTGRWIPIAEAEPFGEGTPLLFHVTPSDGSPAVRGGNSVAAPSLADSFVLGVAFADLDGDGYIGITHLDGNTGDATIEEHELTPVGRRLGRMRGANAGYGELHIFAGGPPGAELDLAIAAIAVTGDPDPNTPENPLPTGAVVMTQLPFYPNLDTKYRQGGQPHENGLFALELEADLKPDPGDPRVGERFTIRTDDSEPTLGSAQARSGAFARMGIARPVSDVAFVGDDDRLRPGLDALGERVLYQMLDSLPLSPDALAPAVEVQLLPLDRLGNITVIEEPIVVTLSTTAGVTILFPDVDGDPTREAMVLSGTVGVSIVLEAESGVSAKTALLVAEVGGAFSRVDILLESLDVDESDTVDLATIERACADGTGESNSRFDPSLDDDRRRQTTTESTKSTGEHQNMRTTREGV